MRVQDLIGLEDDREAVLAASELAWLLSNPARMLLVCALASGKRTVSELHHVLGIEQPGLSRHLAVLRANHLAPRTTS